MIICHGLSKGQLHLVLFNCIPQLLTESKINQNKHGNFNQKHTGNYKNEIYKNTISSDLGFISNLGSESLHFVLKVVIFICIFSN